jgi:hypothetical protein
MKFKDPLATLNYTGGNFPTHLMMTIFAGYTFFYSKNKIVCDEAIQPQNGDRYGQVLAMLVAHLVSMACYIGAKCLSKKKDHTAYIKKVYSMIGMCTYLGCYLNIQYWIYLPLSEELRSCHDSTKENTAYFSILNCYTTLEIFIFYA